MPYSPLKPCSYAGCSRLVRAGRCELHKREHDFKRDQERQRLYDRHWKRVRRVHLAEHPWCEECLRNGFYVPATDVHHLVPHRGDRDIFMSSPLESLCKSCHSKRTVREGV